MCKHKYPGVYIEELSWLPPSVAQVETAIPVFIGYTKRAMRADDSFVFEPIRISSMLEYESIFSTAFNESQLVINVDDYTVSNIVSFSDDTAWSPYKMYYALKMFFANGGGPCYIISVGLYDQGDASQILYSDLKQGLDIAATVDEITLINFPDATGLQSHEDYYRLLQDVLLQCNNLKDRFAIIDAFSDMPYTQNGSSFTPVEAFRQFVTLDTEYLQYGACYFPYLKTVLKYTYKTKDVKVRLNTNTIINLRVLAKKDKKLFKKIKQFINDQHIILPPGSSIAGVYSRVDATRGVWKAPANISLNYVAKPTVELTTNELQNLNIDAVAGKSINPIKMFHGRGTMVWGARTLAGNDNEWRYVSVRRFFNMVEESVAKAVSQFVFEPNDANTWVKAKSMISNFLTLQWRAGAMAGAKLEDAFFVKIGLGETMTAQDILDNKMIIEIGMAVLRPAEFIILRLNQTMTS